MQRAVEELTSTALYRLLPPLVVRRQFPVPLQQLRLPALQGNLLPADEHVLDSGRELERIARPHDDIGDFARLERAVAIGHAENLGRRQRHRAQRLLPAHAVRHRVSGLLAQIARVVRVGLHQSDLHAGLGEQRGVLVPHAERVVRRDVVERLDQGGHPRAGDLPGDLTSICSMVAPSRSINTAWPLTRFPVGVASTVVMPSTRVTGISIDAGLSPSATLNAAAIVSPRTAPSRVPATKPISTRPTWPAPSISPGVTHFPWASMRTASAGVATPVPPATILPSRTSTVTFVSLGPETGYTVPT